MVLDLLVVNVGSLGPILINKRWTVVLYLLVVNVGSLGPILINKRLNSGVRSTCS